jgi:hypothetical protein
MFITWLLSFYYQDYVFHAHVLSSLISAHNAYIDDQDCVGACHLKNYFFCYHLLMTHKYRGCIVVLLVNKSVEPNEEQKVLTSGFDQGFTVNTSKRVFRSIW